MLYAIMQKSNLERYSRIYWKFQIENHHPILHPNAKPMLYSYIINKIKLKVDASKWTISILLIFINYDRVVSLNLVRIAFEVSCKVEVSKFVQVSLTESLQAIKALCFALKPFDLSIRFFCQLVGFSRIFDQCIIFMS